MFLFQQGQSRGAEHAFRQIAAATNGAFFHFNPHVERVAGQLSSKAEATANYAVGSMAALEVRDDEPRQYAASGASRRWPICSGPSRTMRFGPRALAL